MDINSWDKETHISSEVVGTISELNVECQLFVNKGTCDNSGIKKCYIHHIKPIGDKGQI